eukprot:CAMPEP_0119471970 /NCGR_PEP_ID=MMETSP1344-20130328/4224_1 /TAXON_ID=236787 /ORGANISM="Florenciella parvula, Strain CCMP2471" /LENGTH=95 /DNA_ID=CAMNT_0007504839 /DNA_START=24 /DNA_END=308 /DNA_ORIENTATION=+
MLGILAILSVSKGEFGIGIKTGMGALRGAVCAGEKGRGGKRRAEAPPPPPLPTSAHQRHQPLTNPANLLPAPGLVVPPLDLLPIPKYDGDVMVPF